MFHTTFIGVKPSCSRFDKINGFIRVYDGTKYLVVFNLEKYNAIFDRIRYFIGVKSDRTYVFLTFMQGSRLIKITTTIIYFLGKGSYKNPKNNHNK